VAGNPYAFWDDVAELWVRAVRLASDREALGRVRGPAAALCRLLSIDVAPDACRAILAVEAASNRCDGGSFFDRRPGDAGEPSHARAARRASGTEGWLIDE
jgi:hypothetical protein